MTEEEKYRRKAELLRRAIRIADELDQAEVETGSAKAPVGDDRTGDREAESTR